MGDELANELIKTLRDTNQILYVRLTDIIVAVETLKDVSKETKDSFDNISDRLKKIETTLYNYL
jgi:hypothetical protein